MDYIDYSPPSTVSVSKFPSVVASPSSPKTLYQAHTYITYVNIGSGWTPLCQTTTNSYYAALDATTKAAVIESLTVPSVVAPKVGKSSADVVGKH